MPNLTPRESASAHRGAFSAIGMDDDHLTVVPITDDHMAPTMRQGDTALVDPRVTHYQGQGLYVLDNHGEPVVRRIAAKALSRGIRDIICDNKVWPTETVSTDVLDRLVLGKVVALGLNI